MRSFVVLVLVAHAAGCASDSIPPAPESDTAFDFDLDGKSDTLRVHTSPIQEIGEIGTSFTEETQAHAWMFTLGMNERVSIWTDHYSGDTGPEIDTVLYLYKKQGARWGRYILKNDNASADTLWSRIDADLAPGEYRFIAGSKDDDARGMIGVNMRCGDGFCNYFDPADVEEPEDIGMGEPDAPRPGDVSFRMPLIGDDGKFLSRFNDELIARGLPTFPDSLTMTEVEAGRDEFDRYQAQAEREDVAEVIETEMFSYGDPPALMEHDNPEAGLCYEGEPSALPDFLQGFSDNVFSDMFVVWGWRVDGLSAYGDDWREPTTASPIFEEWHAAAVEDGDVLLVFSTDDDGNERTASVPRCP